jgi:ABC-type amino acid transport substrate-binding protein
VLPGTFKRQDYGFALKEGSDLREPINRSMLTRIVQPRWEETLEFYFGE